MAMPSAAKDGYVPVKKIHRGRIKPKPIQYQYTVHVDYWKWQMHSALSVLNLKSGITLTAVSQFLLGHDNINSLVLQ